MGIVTCANEQYGYVDDDPAIERHLGVDDEGSVYRTTFRVLERARDEAVTPSEAAATLADEAARVPHPLWGHRGWLIIRSLIDGGWTG